MALRTLDVALTKTGVVRDIGPICVSISGAVCWRRIVNGEVITYADRRGRVGDEIDRKPARPGVPLNLQ